MLLVIINHTKSTKPPLKKICYVAMSQNVFDEIKYSVIDFCDPPSIFHSNLPSKPNEIHPFTKYNDNYVA
jgi:hypothetical protein